ncbi:expressed unknown protein [Seminavis robusta]|uniref:Glycosyltransferase 61 catalytic domain-containing protein n=1 Tax=Seminavis robusta TaxID=568900 RepID=A0A9N8HWU5_9STRA|nr:expressed unknown protein [Seminavis robusta]|eukprot:Sro2309_g322800.1 n/a (1773) ;mRNA; f:9798-15505
MPRYFTFVVGAAVLMLLSESPTMNKIFRQLTLGAPQHGTRRGLHIQDETINLKEDLVKAKPENDPQEQPIASMHDEKEETKKPTTEATPSPTLTTPSPTDATTAKNKPASTESPPKDSDDEDDEDDEDDDTGKFVIHSIVENGENSLPIPPEAALGTTEKPYVAETHYNNGTLPLQDLFQGPARPQFPKHSDHSNEANLVFPNHDSAEAVCRIADFKLYEELPHNFQQLVRCFSWWQIEQNKNKTPVLYIQKYNSNGRANMESIHAMYQAMHDAFGVRLDVDVRANTDSPEVHVDAPWRAMDVQTKTYAMASSEHAKTMMDGVLNHYTPDNDKRAGCPAATKDKKSKPVIAFVDRKDSKRRSIGNSQAVVDKLHAAGYDVHYQSSFHGMSLLEQIKFMSEADIVMGPHGQQFTTSLFLPQCGSLFEFFNRQYYSPNFFGSMVAMSGKHHFFTYEGGETTMKKMQGPRRTKQFDVSVGAVLQVTEVMVERWHSCCAAQAEATTIMTKKQGQQAQTKALLRGGAAEPVPSVSTGNPAKPLSNNKNGSTRSHDSNELVIHSIVEPKKGGWLTMPPEAVESTSERPYVAETHYNNGTLPIPFLFRGPGRPDYQSRGDRRGGDESKLIFPNHDSNEAVCQLSDEKLANEFPHNFQQLVRCFSWWQLEQNKDKTPVLFIQKYNHTWRGKMKNMDTVHATYKAMQDVFGVRLDIENRTNPDSPEVHVEMPWRRMYDMTRTYAMVSSDHAKTLVEGMLDYYTPSNSKRAGCPADSKSEKPKPVIAFLDRQDSRRYIGNIDDVLDKLRKAGHDVLYQPSFKGMSLTEQIKFMSEADIVMGPHGAQFTTSMFIPQCGSLFEFFPREYYAPNWFGSMVAMSGKHHFFTYEGGTPLLDKARELKLYNASAEVVEQVTGMIVDRWYTCCAAQASTTSQKQQTQVRTAPWIESADPTSPPSRTSAPKIDTTSTDKEGEGQDQRNEFIIHSIVAKKKGEMIWISGEAVNSTREKPYVAETHYHNGTVPIQALFTGPGRPEYRTRLASRRNDESQLDFPNGDANEAVCQLADSYLYHEFPHNFQKLVRCFSWWQLEQNKNRTPVLYIQQYNMTWKDHTFNMDSIHAIYQAMQDVFGVRLDIENRTNPDSPEVYVEAPWRKMSRLTRIYAMVSPEHAKTMVAGVLNYYMPSNGNRAGCPAAANDKKSKPVIALLDRQDARRRKLANSNEILDRLRRAGYDVRYQPSFKDMSWLDQVKFMSEVDILMGPHGAQFTTSMFMPQCGSLFEFFNEHYYVPNWFGSMMAMSGKHHFFTYDGGDANVDQTRGMKNYNASADAVEQVTRVMVERWHSCCNGQQQENERHKKEFVKLQPAAMKHQQEEEQVKALLRGGLAEPVLPLSTGIPAQPPSTTKTSKSSSQDQQDKFVIHDIVEPEKPGWLMMPDESFTGTYERPFVAETHYINGTLPIRDLFKGPGRPEYPSGSKNRDEASLVFPNQNSSEAVCQLSNSFLFQYYPHNFQQLVRCFSWWQLEQNKNKTPVLYIQEYDHYSRRKKTNMDLVHFLYDAFHDAFGVRLDIENRTNTDSPEVHVEMPWRKMYQQTRTYAMVSPEHAKTMAEGLLNYYTPNNDKRAGCPRNGNNQKSKPVIAYIDRQDSRRAIANSDEVLARLNKAGYDVRYLPSFNGTSWIEQINFMSEVDIVMGPHGQQFTTSMFIPQCGSLFEFFPRGYYVPNWFGSMAAMSGKHHFFTYEGGNAKVNDAREVKLYNVSAPAVEQVTAVMVERWHSCCANQKH